MNDQISWNLGYILYDLGIAVLIVGGLYTVLHLALRLAALRARFTDKELRAAGMNHDQRRAFFATRKRQPSNKKHLKSARKARTKKRK